MASISALRARASRWRWRNARTCDGSDIACAAKRTTKYPAMKAASSSSSANTSEISSRHGGSVTST